MKRTIAFLTLAALLFAGCSKSDLQKQSPTGEDIEVLETVTFSAQMPDQSAVQTKGTASFTEKSDGGGEHANRCIIEIYYNNKLFKRDIKAVSNKTASFSFQMPANRTYDVLFWADRVDDNTTSDGLATDKYYKTNSEDGLKNVSMTGTYVGNDDKRDAFFHYESCTIAQGGTSKNFTLKRPFSQINVYTTDVKYFATAPDAIPEYVDVTLKNAYTAINVMTGELSGEDDIKYKTSLYDFPNPDVYDLSTVTRAKLSMDYVFATTAQSAIDITWKALKGTNAEIVHEFTSIPYAKNYRTNIIGDLLTAIGQWTVEVDAEWDGNLDQKIIKTGSVEAANEALKKGKTNITITNPTDTDTPISFPEESDGKDIIIQVSGANGKTLTFNYGSGAAGPATLQIFGDASYLDVNTPNTHVEAASGTYVNANVATSSTTFVVGKDVTITTLNVTQGNVEIRGCVTNITKAQNIEVNYHISTAAALRSVASQITSASSGTPFIGKIYLEGDIDLENEEWAPIQAFQKELYINGQGYTIRNLKVSESSSLGYIGFISSACGLTVKNLNFDKASLTYPESVTDENARAGVIAGMIYGCTIDSCSVKNVTIKACQKVGALVGYLVGETNVPNTVTNCSADNVSISSNVPGKILEHGSGGFIGNIALMQNPLTTVSGCSVSNVTIADYNQNPYSAAQLQKVPHVFIGSVCSNYEGAETPSISSHSIVLSNNTISGTNTELPTCIYSSKYFGWGGNAEERPTWKGEIYVDGEKWVPDYSFECDGVKYATLEKAIAAVASASDKTVRIIKAGEYTVEALNAKNCTIEATVDGVVFNHTPGYGKWITSGDAATVTVKNITWNVGNASYQMMYASLDNCTVNGMFFTGATQTFKDCIFVNEEGYNMWIYGTDATFDNCEFTCPGKNDGVEGAGSVMNLFNEGTAGGVVHNVIVKDCNFTALYSSNKYPAMYIKPEVAFNVTITNSTANDNFFTNAISGSKVWGLKNNNNKSTTVTVDGNLVYANGSPLYISTPSQLQNFADAVNSGNTFSGKTITLESDIDLSGISNWTPVGNVNNNFWGTFDGKGHTISNLTINNDADGQNVCTGFFGWINSATIKNVNFSNADVTGHHYVGVVAGYMEAIPTCTIIGCNVTGSEIKCTYKSETADGDKCGGIVGYAGNPGSYVTNCTVSSTAVSAGRDAGQAVGMGIASLVTGCTATSVTVTANGTGTGANIRNEIIGRLQSE